MTRFLTLLALSLSTLLSWAQGFRALAPYEVEGGKLLTTVVVNGVEGRFLIDTGAPCCVSHSFAQRAHIPAGRTAQAEDSNGQSLTTTLVRLDSLRLGRTTFRSLDAMQWEAGNPTEQMGIDGILGYNLFRMGALRFDARGRRLFFAATGAPLHLREDCALPLIADAYLPLIALPLRNLPPQAPAVAKAVSGKGKGKSAPRPAPAVAAAVDTVMFDAGAADFYEMSTRSYQRLRQHPALRTLASAVGTLSMGAAGVEQASLKHRVRIDELPLSGLRFQYYATTTTDASLSRLGTALLEHGDVAIDYRAQKFYFLPFALSDSATTIAAEEAELDLYEPEWDVVITLSAEGYLTAGIVWNAQLPIAAGDRIVAVNGQRFDTPLSLREATTQGQLSMPGERASLTFVSAKTGREQTIQIRKR